MNRVFRTVAVPLEHATTISAVAASLGPATLSFAWTANAGPPGADQTHQVSSGLVSEAFAQALASPQAFQAALAPIAEITPEQAQAVWASLDVGIEEAPLALERLGLQIHATESSGGAA
jgi:hypothetical protein